MLDDPDVGNDSAKAGLKRKRKDAAAASSSSKAAKPQTAQSPDGPVDGGDSSVSGFRNVSACYRCRTRKNKCDQKLPACSGCEKSGTPCVGFDPVLNRKIPRNYVLYLEKRVGTLEALLTANGISCPPATDMAVNHADLQATSLPPAEIARSRSSSVDAGRGDNTIKAPPSRSEDLTTKHMRDFTGPDKRATLSAISFATVVREAVSKHISKGPRDKSASRATPSSRASKDSFFGLCSPLPTKAAAFPGASTAKRLCNLYFEHSNPQVPILHRGEFCSFIDRATTPGLTSRSPRMTFFVQIICAIGSAIIMDDPSDQRPRSSATMNNSRVAVEPTVEPEEYYAAAIEALGGFHSSSRAVPSTPSGLEELQAILLVANYSLLRPVAPGLWYIAGTAMRLAKNLGLYTEMPLENLPEPQMSHALWTRDMKRRLWYCTFSMDRLVAVCIGRPTSIEETVITTPFPSVLDDAYITPNGFLPNPRPAFGDDRNPPISYKHVSYHYFRLRLLQSEILKVLETRRAQIIRAKSANSTSASETQYLPSHLQEPFLDRFQGDFRLWRHDMDARLRQWRAEMPRQQDTGVSFEPLLLELNYWQSQVMLYRQSLNVPGKLASEMDDLVREEARAGLPADHEEREDEETVFYKAGVAGQQVLRVYKLLHTKRLVNYTYLATHHIFVCGVSFLYAIWQSAMVRKSIGPEDIDLTVLAATTVLTDLIPKCPPAQNARDAFKRMSKVTLAFYLSENKRTAAAATARAQHESDLRSSSHHHQYRQRRQPSIDTLLPTDSISETRPTPPTRPKIEFDTGFKNLFSAEDLALRSPELVLPRRLAPFSDTGMSTAAASEASGPSSSIARLLPSVMDVPPHHHQPPQRSTSDAVPLTPAYAASLYSNDSTEMAARLQLYGGDDAFWASLAEQEDVGGLGGDVSGLGFELGFGAGDVDCWRVAERNGEFGGAGSAWQGKGFEMLDGWLLGGGGGGGGGSGVDEEIGPMGTGMGIEDWAVDGEDGVRSGGLMP